MADEHPPNEMDLPDPSEPFGPDLLLVAHCLAAGMSHAAAGMEVARTAKWVQRRLVETPGLREYVVELKMHRAAEASAALGDLLPQAVQAAKRGLTSEKISDQLRAASLVFDQFRNFRADSAIADRMAELRGEIDELKEQVSGPRDVVEVTGS